MNGVLGKLLSNPHTTGAGGAFVIIKAARHIANLWTPPHYHAAVDGTAEGLEAVAVFYGYAMAGDAGKAGKDLQEAKAQVAEAISTGNTSTLTKAETLK